MICRVPKQEDLFDLSDKIIYVDIPKIIADKKVQMYLGSGIEFKHKDKDIHKLWHELVELNNFIDIMYLVERQMSEMGGQFVTLNKSKEGKCLVNIVQPYFANNIAEAYVSPVAACFTENLLIDNNMHLVRSVYDKEKVVRTMWSGDGTQINIQEYKGKLPKEYELDWGDYDKKTNSYVFYHNFGFIPVMFFKNKPFKHYYPVMTSTTYFQSPFTTSWNYQSTGWTYESVKDTATCSGLILQLQNLYTQKWKLALLDKPRVILNGISQGLSNGLLQKKQQSYASNFLSDLIVNAGYGGANGAGMQIMSPTNNLSNYDDAIENLQRDIFNKCGLSYQVQTSTQKTSTESFSNFQESLQTLNFMREYHTNQWIDLIEKMFKICGKELGNREDWSFQVKRNIVIDESTQVDNILKEINCKSKTPIDMIAIRNGIDEDNAKLIWEKNKKFYEENEDFLNPQDTKLLDGTNGGQTGQVGKAGRKPEGE